MRGQRAGEEERRWGEDGGGGGNGVRDKRDGDGYGRY